MQSSLFVLLLLCLWTKNNGKVCVLFLCCGQHVAFIQTSGVNILDRLPVITIPFTISVLWRHLKVLLLVWFEAAMLERVLLYDFITQFCSFVPKQTCRWSRRKPRLSRCNKASPFNHSFLLNKSNISKVFTKYNCDKLMFPLNAVKRTSCKSCQLSSNGT